MIKSYPQIKPTNMETKKLTVAENTLATMATVVLILGIIGSVAVFFSSCISWEISPYSGKTQGMDGINWLGISAFIYCIMATIIAWSVLSILVEISVNVRSKNVQTTNWEKDFAVMVATKNTIKAKEILYRAIFESEEFKLVLTGGNETFHQGCIEKLNATFGKYLKAIGEDRFTYSESNDYLMVFK